MRYTYTPTDGDDEESRIKWVPRQLVIEANRLGLEGKKVDKIARVSHSTGGRDDFELVCEGNDDEVR